jgi:hypothetical protein
MIDQLKGFCGCQIDTLFQMKKKSLFGASKLSAG